jgi:hypothetical protein
MLAVDNIALVDKLLSVVGTTADGTTLDTAGREDDTKELLPVKPDRTAEEAELGTT